MRFTINLNNARGILKFADLFKSSCPRVKLLLPKAKNQKNPLKKNPLKNNRIFLQQLYIA